MAKDYPESEQYFEFGGLANNFLPLRGTCSPVRMYMFGTHFAQAPVPLGCTKDRFWTPAHFEYAKYTFAVEVKRDCQVIAEIPKYMRHVTHNSYRMNPSTTYLVRDIHTGEYDIIEKTRYHSSHNNFAIEYVDVQETMRKVNARDTLWEGERLAQSPSIDTDGRLRPGVLAKTVFTSSPYVAEDGYKVSDTFCDSMTTTGYGRMVINVPEDHYLLHVAGTPENPKALPSPGEYIRKDGLLVAMRRHDDILDGIAMSPRMMQEVDFFFDRKVYIESYCREAMVVDIEVYRNEANVSAYQPYKPDDSGLPTDDVSRHAAALRDYHARVLAEYEKIQTAARRERRVAEYSPALTHLIHHSEGMTGTFPGVKGKVDTVPMVGRSEELSGTHIVITYAYKVRAGIGSKITGCSGNKGVICKIEKQENMRRDAHGNYADIEMSNMAPINRMSGSVWFEHYYHYKADETEREIRRIWKEGPRDFETYRRCYHRALAYYAIIVPMFHDAIVSKPRDKEFIRDHVDDILANGLDMEFDSLTPNIGIDAVREMETQFPSKYANAVRYGGYTGTEEEWNQTEQGRLRVQPVTMVDELGIRRTSRVPMMIGASYFLMLEHTGKSYSASMAPEAQVHGVPAKTSKADRHSQPYHLASGRMYGEADVRSEIGQTSPYAVADQIDRVNNPHVQEAIMRKVVESSTPSNIDSLVDREKHPVGEGLHLAFMRNHFYCAGAELAYYDVDKLGVPPRTVVVESEEDEEEYLEDDAGEDEDLDDGEMDYEREEEDDD